MKKNKFDKFVGSSIGKQVIFNAGNGGSIVGYFVGKGSDPDTIVVRHEGGDSIVDREQIIGKVKKNKWFTMDQVPPEGRLVLLESKTGEIKMGRLLEGHAKDFYELDTHHFHSNYWHKPFPATDFTHWCLVQKHDRSMI